MKLEKLSRYESPVPRKNPTSSLDSRKVIFVGPSRNRHLYDAVDRCNVWGRNKTILAICSRTAKAIPGSARQKARAITARGMNKGITAAHGPATMRIIHGRAIDSARLI